MLTGQVQNIAYEKSVKVYAAAGNNWGAATTLTASYKGPGQSGYETWEFSGTATGATQFFIRYDVQGQS